MARRRSGGTRVVAAGERGAQSLEWIGLGAFVLTALAGATAYANAHLGDQLAHVLFDHLQATLGK